MSNLYVLRKSVEEEIDRIVGIHYIGDMEERLLALPTIDPLATIDEMIEDIKRYSNGRSWTVFTTDIAVLKELKSRLSLTK